MAVIHYLHKIACMRSRIMGDPTCYSCRKLAARSTVLARSNARTLRLLKPRGLAETDTLVAARCNMRSESGS